MTHWPSFFISLKKIIIILFQIFLWPSKSLERFSHLCTRLFFFFFWVYHDCHSVHTWSKYSERFLGTREYPVGSSWKSPQSSASCWLFYRERDHSNHVLDPRLGFQNQIYLHLGIVLIFPVAEPEEKEDNQGCARITSTASRHVGVVNHHSWVGGAIRKGSSIVCWSVNVSRRVLFHTLTNTERKRVRERVALY